MIEVLNLQDRYWIDPRTLKRLLESLVQRYKLPDPEVTLALVGSKRIRRLNREFRKKDAPTDVLSFPGAGKSADGKYYLGDIIISVPQAFKQSFRETHGLETELADLTIHGFLHLLGFDHGRGVEEEEIQVRGALWGE